MVVDFQVAAGVCIVRLNGRFATGQDSIYLREKADEIKKSGHSKILVDFGDVSYIDSTGIGFLIGMYTSAVRDRDGMFVLANPNRRVREVLDLCRLSTVIPIYPDEPSALEALKQGRHVSAPQAG